MELRIEQSFARIGLNIKDPFLNLDVSSPRLNLRSVPPRMEITSRLPDISIDQTQCFADMGKRTPIEFMSYMANLAWALGQQGTERIAAEGEMLASIEDGLTVSDIAFENSFDVKEYDVAAVPSHPPEIGFAVYPVNIKVEPGTVETHLEPGAVRGNLDWGQVRAYLLQPPQLDIQYVGKNYDIII
ncbi:MAG: hypothetical protein HPY90_08065 [Syntrophothermus sp.]|uniref:DUF6470 family protein n=1 Tax=Syntrophothermus sp. TaxID=2736299 RepID=UPI00257FE25F|nr:DUF6470 family protein [Syntrophothermus sp.]NSW83217.1 hypothetical protein [Syntrophothermus sp.]